MIAGPNNCPFNGSVRLSTPATILINNYPNPQWYANFSKDFTNEIIEDFKREDLARTITHEAGHTFGLMHASGIDCKNNGKPVPISDNCQRIEYGDSSSVMGNRYTFFSATQNFYLGWLPQTRIEKLPYSSEKVVYEKTITAVESSLPGAKLLIAQGSPSSGLSFLPSGDLRISFPSAYYISYRKKTESFFTQNPYPMPDDFYQGATIQIGSDNSNGRTIPHRNPDGIPDQVWLINTSAGLQGDYTLKNGKNFYDPEQRILIEQLRKDDDTVTVRVTYNSDPPPSLPPISGKLKIIANGQKYKDVWISVLKIKNENPVEYGDLLADYRPLGFPVPLPTDQDQEISFSIPNLTESKYALVPNLITEDGRHISAPSRIICPNSPAGPFGCLVNTGSTGTVLTLTIPQ